MTVLRLFLRLSLIMPRLYMAAESHVKYILFSFSLLLCFRVFMVTHFHLIFYFIFHFIFCLFTAKLIENELKMGLKMSWKWLKNGYHGQPYSTSLLLVCDTQMGQRKRSTASRLENFHRNNGEHSEHSQKRWKLEANQLKLPKGRSSEKNKEVSQKKGFILAYLTMCLLE